MTVTRVWHRWIFPPSPFQITGISLNELVPYRQILPSWISSQISLMWGPEGRWFYLFSLLPSHQWNGVVEGPTGVGAMGVGFAVDRSASQLQPNQNKSFLCRTELLFLGKKHSSTVTCHRSGTCFSCPASPKSRPTTIRALFPGDKLTPPRTIMQCTTHGRKLIDFITACYTYSRIDDGLALRYDQR